MFKRTLDTKEKYVDNEGYELVDLGAPIFNGGIFGGISMSIYKIGQSLEMRPDLISRSMYGDEEYTELVMKYNNIQNPFSIKRDDVLIFPSSVDIEKKLLVPVEEQKANQDSLIRAFHKYVDKNKKPDTIGSEKNNTEIKENSNGDLSNLANKANENLGSNVASKFKEANLATLGASAVKEIDGRLYFGTDTGMKCAVNGISTSAYMKEIIKNASDKK